MFAPRNGDCRRLASAAGIANFGHFSRGSAENRRAQKPPDRALAILTARATAWEFDAILGSVKRVATARTLP